MFKSAFVIISAFLIVTTYGSDNEEDLLGKASKKITEITELAKNTIGNIGKEKSIFDNIVSDRESILDDLPAGINASSIPSIEEGEDLIRKKCLQHGRNDTFDDIKAAEEDLKYCIMDLFNFDTIQEEIEKYKPTGDLDIVFKKYCRKMPKVKSCIQNFTVAIDPCLNEQEKDAKQLIVNITESLDRFICFKEGDRIALFIAEGGPDCLSDKQEAIQHCVNETFTSEVPDINDLPTFKLQEPECRNINNFQRCVVSELEKCSEPTPANIVDSLINYVRQSTPCSQYKAEGETSSAAIKYVNVFTLISSLFLLILNIKQ